MCKYRSAVAILRSDETIELRFLPGNDSHEAIRNEYGIRDNDFAGTRQTPLEFVPTKCIKDLNSYQLIFDAGKPAWWTDGHTEDAIRQFKENLQPCVDSNIWNWTGGLDLSSLTTLPEGVTINAGGDLFLGSLTTLPGGVTLKAGRSLDLCSLTTLPGGVTLKAGRSLDLCSLTTLPGGVTLNAGRYLDLCSLTTLPGGVTLNAGGYLDLCSLTTLPEGVTLKCSAYYMNDEWHKGPK